MDDSCSISSLLGKQVLVRLNSNVNYKGSLIALDGYMNVALEGAEEFIGDTFKRKYGDTFIRGNNSKIVLIICSFVHFSN